MQNLQGFCKKIRNLNEATPGVFFILLVGNSSGSAAIP